MKDPHDASATPDDPIVTEVRAQRDSIAAELDYDLDALVSRLQALEDVERKTGRKILPAPGKSGAAA